MSRWREFTRRRVLAPILEQLRGGITPEKIAVAVAAGCVLGLFPVLGSTTLLCALAAIALRLNQPIIQMTNYLVYPLQLASILGFYRAGEWLFGLPHLPLTIPMLLERFQAGPARFIADYGMLAVRGIIVWIALAPLVFALLYAGLRAPLRAFAARHAHTSGCEAR